MKRSAILFKESLPVYRIIAASWIVLILTSLSFISACSSSQSPTGLDVGNPAPDFTLTDLDGNQVSLSGLRGKIVFLNFWSINCPYCRAEMPDMETLYQEYKDQDVAIIGIDLYEDENNVRDFVQGEGYSWTFVIDKTGAVSNDYEIITIPTSFFLDTEGIIRAAKVGPMSIDDMESNLAKMIN